MPVAGLALRPVALLAALALACAACSGDKDASPPDPSASLTDIAVDCDRYEDTARRITEAQTALYDGKDSPGDASAVDELVAELEALEDEAPDDVDTALAGLADGFRTAEQVLAAAPSADAAELPRLSTGLAEDSQVVTAWILEQCGQ